MSSCTLFKALGLVNKCDDESPIVPEEVPIDKGRGIADSDLSSYNTDNNDVSVRIKNKQDAADKSAMDHLDAHKNAQENSEGSTNDTLIKAKKVVSTGVYAHGTETNAKIAGSINA